jgi:hypothetical protein
MKGLRTEFLSIPGREKAIQEPSPHALFPSGEHIELGRIARLLHDLATFGIFAHGNQNLLYLARQRRLHVFSD